MIDITLSNRRLSLIVAHQE